MKTFSESLLEDPLERFLRDLQKREKHPIRGPITSEEADAYIIHEIVPENWNLEASTALTI